jgi:hypothetical protein
MVIPFIPGSNALWDPWQGSHNGKGLTEDAFDNATKVILNQDFVSGLTSPRSSSTTSPTSPPRQPADRARVPVLAVGRATIGACAFGGSVPRSLLIPGAAP